jgi:hypothetical protein
MIEKKYNIDRTLKLLICLICIVLKPGPAGRPGIRPTRGWNRVGFKKNKGNEKPGLTGKTRLQPADFCFFY